MLEGVRVQQHWWTEEIINKIKNPSISFGETINPSVIRVLGFDPAASMRNDGSFSCLTALAEDENGQRTILEIKRMRAVSYTHLITDAGNRIPRSTANVSLTWILAPQFQNELGEVRLRYVSSRMNVNDRLYIDVHLVEGVMIGATISEIAEGIWVHNIRNRALDGTHRSAGYFLSRRCV